MSTDALAMAQLELFYRLGVLERQQQPPASPVSTSNVRLPRTDVRADLPGDVDSVGEELRCALPVHPHDHVKRLNDGDADYELYGGKYDTNVKPLSTTSRARAYGSVSTSPPSSSIVTLAPPSRDAAPAEDSTQRSAAHVVPLLEALVRNAREKANVRAIWVFHAKKRTFAAWARVVQCQKRLRMQHRTLLQWNARRTARKWRKWATSHQRIRLLIENARFSLISRLRKRRVWLRWLRFAAQRATWNAILKTRLKIRNQRLVLSMWRELKVFACRRRQDRRGLRKFLYAFRGYRDSGVVKRNAVIRNQLLLKRSAQRRLLSRWRNFVALQTSTRRIQRQIVFRISRKRYFRIWRECMRDNQCIAEFKTRRTEVSVHQHFIAWSFAAKALRLARKKSVKAHKSTRERFFRVWKQETAFSMRCQSATQEYERWRLSKALERLHAHVHEMRRQCRIEDRWKYRVLERVWRLGFLKFHQLEQDVKAEMKSLGLQQQRSHFGTWVQFWKARIQRRALGRATAELSLRNRFRCSFARWRRHWRQRKVDKERLADGTRHHHNRLMQSGVYKLSLLVSQRSENAERSVQIRRHVRLLTKARYFRDWKRWTRSKQEERSRLVRFHERARYLQSWFNPYRRVWSSWREFTRSSTRMQQMEAIYQSTLKRKCINGWRRRAQLGRKSSQFLRLVSEKMLERSFSSWRSRTSHWQKMREVFALARAVYRRKRCGKILHVWSRWTRNAVKMRLKQQQLEELTRLKTLESCFQSWNAQFLQRSKAFHHAAHRQMSWKARCLWEWQRYIVKHVKLKRKLAYFQQVFGKHPTTSLVQRDWVRWTRYTRIRRGIKSLRQRQHCAILRQSRQRWKFFHTYNLVFREWHRVAALNALESGHFGKRLRLFFDSRRHLLKMQMVGEWKMVYRRKKSEREALLSVKHRTLQVIVSRSIQHSQARAKYLKKWFSRWHKGVYARCNAAKHYYEAKLARRALVVWWRLMVNTKQELVLSEAKHVLGSLSFYHPQQQLYTRIVKEKALQMRAARAMNRESKRPREATMKTMRRMLDPEEKRKYSSVSHLGHDRRRHTAPEASGEGQTTGVSSRHVRFQTSDRGVTMMTKSKSHKVHFKEPMPLRTTTPDSLQHVASTPYNSRTRETSQNERQPRYKNELKSSQPCSDVSLADPRTNKRNTVRLRGQAAETELSTSRDRFRHQQHQYPDRTTSDHNREHVVADELPLFDPPTPPRQDQSRESICIQSQREPDARYQLRDNVAPQREQSIDVNASAVSIQEEDTPSLPLFDTDAHQDGASLAPVSWAEQGHRESEKPPVLHHHARHASGSSSDVAPGMRSSSLPPSSEVLLHQRPRVAGNEQCAVNDGEISLEQLASMELFAIHSSPGEQSRQLDSVYPMPQPIFATPSLAPEHKHRVRNMDEASLLLPPPRKSSEMLSLSAILELPEKHTQRAHEATKTGTVQAGVREVQELNSGDVLNEILDHYARCLVNFPAGKEKEADAKTTGRRKQICFRMLRDVGLFHNQFYFPQMESVMDSINVEHIAAARDQVKVPLDDTDNEYLHHLEVEYLKRFLANVIDEHPLYKATLTGNSREYQSASRVDDERLQWLVQVHLQPWVSMKMTKQSRGKPFWIQSPLPNEVESALEKLLLCISKYFKVLAQLFSTRVSEQTNRNQSQQRDRCQQMTKTEFTQLLKQVHVFPQLLNKRELECAFDASCSAVPDQKEINFPEFVEALIRCSSSLQWGESTSNHGNDNNSRSTETGVVVKFLMLLFAMEGKGSVLQKRNEDLQVVVGYLEQQQLEKKAGKMHRFRKLLVDQKRQRGREVRGQHLKHPDRSARWRSPHRPSTSASPRRSGGGGGEDDTNLFYCGEPGVLLHPSSSDMLYDHARTGSLNFRVGENSSHLLDGYQPATDEGFGDACKLNYSSELASPPDTGDERNRFLHSPESEYSRRVGIDMGQQGFPGNPANSNGGNGDRALPAGGFGISTVLPVTRETSLVQSDSAMSPVDDHVIPDTSFYDNVSAKDDPIATADRVSSSAAADLYRVGELQDKNDFLNDILSSIGDVELVLQQSNLQLHRGASSDNVMRALFTATSSSSILQMGVDNRGDEHLLLDQVEDVHVNDPMLDQLTHIERFTDSSGWQAHPTLEGIAELGVHAATSSSVNQVTFVQDSELNDMTDSTFGAHRGGFLDDEDPSKNHNGL